jgi:hypothetical protein
VSRCVRDSSGTGRSGDAIRPARPSKTRTLSPKGACTTSSSRGNAEQILTNKAKFNAESGFQVGHSAREYQIAPLTPEHEQELRTREQLAEQQAADRQAILQKRESLHRLFAEKYAPDVSVFTDGKVEIMFKLGYEQADILLG